MSDMTNIRQQISSGAPWEARVGYTRAVRIGSSVFVSGTTAVGPDGELESPGDAYGQARRCLEIIGKALNEAGAGFGDVVRTRVYLTDIADWDSVARAHAEVFADIRPASTMLEVARLIDPAMRVEIEADAVIIDPA
jgi:enamine deaminase RidA (YjgF/YER057c/UK114 family)